VHVETVSKPATLRLRTEDTHTYWGLRSSLANIAMAVLDYVPGVKVEIIVNGRPLQEYADQDHGETSPTTMTRFVEAQSGQEFAIRYTITRPFPKYPVRFDILLDGQWVPGAYVDKKDASGTSLTHLIEGFRSFDGDKAFLHKFFFSELTIGEPRVGTHALISLQFAKVMLTHVRSTMYS
jgi:hypothetical protein